MLLTVVICTYNREKYIGGLLESIAQNDLLKSKYEIILVDNNCTDNTYEICKNFTKEYPNVKFRYVVEEEQGLSAARNRGIKEANGDLIVYVDDDALVGETYLRSYYEHFENNEKTMAAGGPIEPIYETEEPRWMSRFTKSLLTAWMNYGDIVRPYPKGRYPGGGNAAYRKEVFNHVGFFNCNLGRKGSSLMASEEKDIFDKMKKNRMDVLYLPEPILYHLIPPYKLELSYFNKLTLQMGISERKRTLALGKYEYFKRLMLELIKWGGTLVLFLGYTLLLEFQKGWKLILFRINVSKGLLGCVRNI